MQTPLAFALAFGVLHAAAIVASVLGSGAIEVDAGPDDTRVATKSPTVKPTSGSTSGGTTTTTSSGGTSLPTATGKPTARPSVKPTDAPQPMLPGDEGLPTDGVIQGSVLMRETGEPLAGLRIRLERVGGRDMLEGASISRAVSGIAKDMAQAEEKKIQAELAKLRADNAPASEIEIAEHRLAGVQERLKQADTMEAGPGDAESRMGRAFGLGDTIASIPLDLATVTSSIESSTASDGTFLFTGLVNGAYRIGIADEAYTTPRSASGSVTLRGAAAVGKIDISVESAGILMGTVTNGAGQPIAGANIQISENFDNGQFIRGAVNADRIRDIVRNISFRIAVSDADGHYAVKLPPREYNVSAVAAGYVAGDQVRATVVMGQSVTADVKLQTGGRVVVYVKDQAGEPVVGARVSLNRGRDGGGGGGPGGGRWGGGGGGRGMEVRARANFGVDITQAALGGSLTTGVSGMVVFDNLRDGEYTARVSHAEFVDVRDEGIAVAAGTETRHTVTLEPGAQIELWVQDMDGNAEEAGLRFEEAGHRHRRQNDDGPVRRHRQAEAERSERR
jgi:hypothetical protein